MARHSVSVVIPLYNHARYIEAAVASVLSQTTPAKEIIIVDDGSTDDSAAVAGALAARHPQIAFWSKPNGGAHAAINDGLHRATGEYVAILNSDDIYHPDRLTRMLRVFERDSAARAVGTGLHFIDGQGQRIANPWYDQAVSFYRDSGDLGLSLVNGNIFMTTSNLLLKRAVLDTVGGFSALRYAHDLDFFLRLVARGGGVRRLDEPLVSYRMHDANTINEGHLKVKAEWAAVAAFFLNLLSDRSQPEPADWARIGRLLDILGRHALLRPVLLCLAYFQRYPSNTLERHRFFHDKAFRANLANAVE